MRTNDQCMFGGTCHFNYPMRPFVDSVHSQILITPGTVYKEDYTEYFWRTLADVWMVSEVLRVVPRYRVLR